MRFVTPRLMGVATTIFITMGGLLAGTAPADASVVQYDLTLDTCTGTCGLSNYGTITVSDLAGGGVHVVASLAPSVDFIKSGALSNFALVFSLAGNPNITIPTPLSTTDFSPTDVLGGTPNISAGGTFGSFDYGISCTACGPGGSSPKHGPIIFDITDLSITTASFTDGIITAGHHTTNSGVYFVADVMGPNGNTGRVGAGPGHTPSGNPPPAVPEPATLMLVGAALGGLGAMRRRRR